MKKYLALGDSYTIGELVAAEDNFPNQFCRIINEHGEHFDTPTIIAQTGWTSDELMNAIAVAKPSFDHDLVSLLVGVNNQYRSLNIDTYYWQFYSLLCQAILFARSNPQNVIVVSIPDWGLTPFNKDRDEQIVSAEIDQYNNINRELAGKLGTKYLDITHSTRLHASDSNFLATDLLHYSATEYEIWARQLVNNFIE